MLNKIRADQLMLNLKLVESREQAKRLILAGRVFYYKNKEKVKIKKPGQMLTSDTKLLLEEQERFVSRGGYKLLTAIETFKLDIKGKVALDVGASTGGFTDCLLQFGAKKVYSLDVGYGLLHWKLRNDPRVVVLEKINIRYAPDDLLPEKVDIVVIDCSFISLTKVLPSSIKFLKPKGIVIALVKPQFELEKKLVKKGVVRSEKLQHMAVEKIKLFGEKELGLVYRGVVPSKIKGPKGNQEYLIYFEMPC